MRLPTRPSLLAAALAGSANAALVSFDYWFSFGDSYTATGFDISLDKPSSANPIGNPALPGSTTSGGFNWVGSSVTQYNWTQTLAYNFAFPGAVIDSALTDPTQTGINNLDDQVAIWSANLPAAKSGYAPWTEETAMASVWIGINDIGAYFFNGQAVPQDEMMSRYLDLMNDLYAGGVNNYILVKVPPIERTPLGLSYTADQQADYKAVRASWNAAVDDLAYQFVFNNGVKIATFDVDAYFNEALDNPAAYGAPNNYCYNADGVSCLWHDDYHPGVAIQTLVAEAFMEFVVSVFFTEG